MAVGFTPHRHGKQRPSIPVLGGHIRDKVRRWQALWFEDFLKSGANLTR
jgi:hypothetical protein